MNYVGLMKKKMVPEVKELCRSNEKMVPEVKELCRPNEIKI